MLINRLLKTNPPYRLFVPLPIDFHLFFFGIFASLKDVQEANCFQLLHPLFYHKKQQIDIIKIVAKYRKQDTLSFDRHVNLNRNQYKLAKWVENVSKDSPYSEILEAARLTRLGPCHGKNFDNILIPSCLQNVIKHYRDRVNQHYRDKK
jgi:hypothetical protein